MRIALIASCCLMMLGACKPEPEQALVPQAVRGELSRDFLLGAEPLQAAIPTEAFQPDPQQAASQAFQGRLKLITQGAEVQLDVLTDLFDRAQQPDIASLPEFDFEFVQEGTTLIPVRRGRQAGAHPVWEWILEPGQAWDEASDDGWSRASLPFALGQRNANCTHNGLLSFIYKASGEISRVALQIDRETCHYFQANLLAVVDATYSPGVSGQRTEVIERFVAEQSARLPFMPLAELKQAYPQADLQQFVLHSQDQVSTFGLVIDGINYSGGCPGRMGPYPYCEVLDLPSYSLAKTIVAGTAYMALDQQYPGARNSLVSDYVPECSKDPRWDGVTLSHLLDMSTGNYLSLVDQEDEFQSYDGPLFEEEDHAAKIVNACTLFPRQAEPGSTWVYHSSDTYIAGTMMNAYLRQQTGPQADLFTDVVDARILKPLQLSTTIRSTLRSYDALAQPFSGYGLTLHPDDIARFALFLLQGEGRIAGEQVLQPDQLAAAMQSRPNDPGMRAGDDTLRYNNGVWAVRLAFSGSCPEPVWIPLMSGYGGISVVMMPNNTVYYVFSDGAEFKWADAARESHKLKPFCENYNEDIQ